MDEGFDIEAVLLAIAIVVLTMLTFHPDLMQSIRSMIGLG